MRLDRLPLLHEAMRKANLDRCRFRFVRKPATFDVFFFADRTPYGLMFGLVGGQWSFSVDVHPGYLVCTRLKKPIYAKLCEVLRLTWDPDRPFKPAIFFEELNSQFPKTVSQDNEAKPQDIARYRRDVEEAEKKYFWAWRPHRDRNVSEVTEHNLRKTRELLGEEAYVSCRDENISTVWTDDPNKSNDMWKSQLQVLRKQLTSPK